MSMSNFHNSYFTDEVLHWLISMHSGPESTSSIENTSVVYSHILIEKYYELALDAPVNYNSSLDSSGPIIHVTHQWMSWYDQLCYVWH